MTRPGSSAQPCIVWFTGLSGAGKTTIARHAVQVLNARGHPAFLLDGDVVRKGLCSDLGFTVSDRSENLRRAAEVAALLADSGVIVLAAFITPLNIDRDRIRARLGTYSFIEVFVSTPLAVAEQRDPKGLYRRARSGDLPDFTGIGSPFEPPSAPEIWLDTTTLSASTLASKVVDAVLRPPAAIIRSSSGESASRASAR